jgi:hypothetical protein
MKRWLRQLAAAMAALVLLVACRPTPTVRVTTPMDVAHTALPGTSRPMDALYWQASVLPAQTLRRSPGR